MWKRTQKSTLCLLLARILFVKSFIESFMTWEERGGFMSRGAYILEIRRFLILYTVSLVTEIVYIEIGIVRLIV